MTTLEDVERQMINMLHAQNAAELERREQEKRQSAELLANADAIRAEANARRARRAAARR